MQRVQQATFLLLKKFFGEKCPTEMYIFFHNNFIYSFNCLLIRVFHSLFLIKNYLCWQVFHLIKWENYSNKHNSWEIEDDLVDCREALETFENGMAHQCLSK